MMNAITEVYMFHSSTALEMAGHGKDDVYAVHDKLLFSPPGDIDPESDLGRELDEAGACYDESEDGWYLYT